MKLVKLFLAAAIAAVTLTGCEALAEAVSNSLSFVFSGVTVYDGQTALLGLTYKSEVDWTIANDSKDLVKLEYNDQGKNCVAKFNLPANADKQYKVHLKTSDRNDKSVEAYEGEITVAPWKLMIYKKGSDGQETEIGTTSSFAKNGAGTYVVKMVYLNDKNQWVPVGSVLYRLELITGGHRVAWTSGGAAHLIQDQADTNCSVEFDITAAPSNNCSVTATLGRERDANGNKIDIYQDKNRVDRSVTFTK
jgi:hypothetical protein